ncbi:MAG TPA: hypothetical protein ENN81_12020 [Phycisphaerales bacterium]|nr:hypothetical protein [Phycisphaerales bacterium]
MDSYLDDNRIEQDLDRLEACLGEQIRLARGGETARLEALCRDSGEIIRRFVQWGVTDGELFRRRGERLGRLYGELTLAVHCELSQAAGRLEEARIVRKTLRAYKSRA